MVEVTRTLQKEFPCNRTCSFTVHIGIKIIAARKPFSKTALSNRSKISCTVSDARSLNQQWLTKCAELDFLLAFRGSPLCQLECLQGPLPQEGSTITDRNIWGSAQTLPSVCTYTRTGQVGPFSYACLYVGLFLIGYGWVSCWALISLQQPKHVPNNPKHTCRWKTNGSVARPHLFQSP